MVPPRVGSEPVGYSPRGYRGTPLVPGRFPPYGVCGGLSAVSQPELEKDVADMVLDGLAADEKTLGHLRIGEPLTKQLKHVGLPLGQHLAGRSRWSDLLTEFAQYRGSGIDVARRLELLEG